MANIHFDRDQFRMMFSNDEQLIRQFSESLYSQLNMYKKALLDELAGKSTENPQKLAHKIKGIGKNFWLPILAERAEALEMEIKSSSKISKKLTDTVIEEIDFLLTVFSVENDTFLE